MRRYNPNYAFTHDSIDVSEHHFCVMHPHIIIFGSPDIPTSLRFERTQGDGPMQRILRPQSQLTMAQLP